jgi:hypothetical protein
MLTFELTLMSMVWKLRGTPWLEWPVKSFSSSNYSSLSLHTNPNWFYIRHSSHIPELTYRYRHSIPVWAEKWTKQSIWQPFPFSPFRSHPTLRGYRVPETTHRSNYWIGLLCAQWRMLCWLFLPNWLCMRRIPSLPHLWGFCRVGSWGRLGSWRAQKKATALLQLSVVCDSLSLCLRLVMNYINPVQVDVDAFPSNAIALFQVLCGSHYRWQVRKSCVRTRYCSYTELNCT